jgi:hypothetical protein
MSVLWRKTEDDPSLIVIACVPAVAANVVLCRGPWSRKAISGAKRRRRSNEEEVMMHTNVTTRHGYEGKSGRYARRILQETNTDSEN